MRLRRLLHDADPAVHRAAVALLAWIDDDSDAMRHAIVRDLDAADERTVCNAWLAACVLGALPPEVSPPTTVGPGSLVMGFGRSMAALTPAQRAALERLLPAIAGWDLTRQWPSTLTEMAHHGLPDTPPALAEWLGTDLPHPTRQRPRRPWRRAR